MLKKILRFVRDNFIAGIIVILPISITVFIIRFIVVSLNAVMLNPIIKHLRPYPLYEDQRLLLAKAVVFIAVTILIVLAGLMTRILIVRRFFSFLEMLLLRLPMINKIYSSIKEISAALFGKRRSGLKKVVLVEYPRKGIYTLGFVTSEDKWRINETFDRQEDLISVYVPTTPNPTSGLFVLLKKEEVTSLDMSVEDALKVVISAGAVTPFGKDKAVLEA
jgi:uncharacterized membrane protein